MLPSRLSADSLIDLLLGASAQFESLGQWVFFKIIFDFLDNEILAFREGMVHQMTTTIAWVGIPVATLWIVIQGYRIMTGQSREPMMGLVVNSLRTVIILLASTSMMFGSADLYTIFTDELPRDIAEAVTGSDRDPAETIDNGLTQMQLAMAAIEALPSIENLGIKSDKDRALLLTGIGVAGPAVVGGALLTMYKFALALFVGLGPLFILFLLFPQTKGMFTRWLNFGVGTMFSLAVLSFTVAVAMKMVTAVAANFAAQYLVMMAPGAGAAPGVNTMALQQGGLGIFLTMLILTVPPMASNFFQGVLGTFTPQSIFGANAAKSDATASSGRNGHHPPGTPGSTEKPVNQNDPRLTQGNLGYQHGNAAEKPTGIKTDTHAQDRARTSTSKQVEDKPTKDQ